MVWKRAWLIAKYNLSQSKKGYLLSVLFNLYFSFFIGMALRRVLEQQPGEHEWGDYLMQDILMLTSVSVMGFVMSKEYRNYWNSDTITKKLAYMRSLPIRIEELVLGRFQTLFVCLFAFAPILYIPLYFVAGFGSHLSIVHYVEWAITWLGIGASIGGMYVVTEMGWSGKHYFWFCMASMIGIVLLGVMGAVIGVSYVKATIELVEDYGVLIPALSLIAALLLTRLWMKLTERRLRTRDYAR